MLSVINMMQYYCNETLIFINKVSKSSLMIKVHIKCVTYSADENLFFNKEIHITASKQVLASIITFIIFFLFLKRIFH